GIWRDGTRFPGGARRGQGRHVLIDRAALIALLLRRRALIAGLTAAAGLGNAAGKRQRAQRRGSRPLQDTPIHPLTISRFSRGVSGLWLKSVEPAEIGLQRLGNRDRTILLLIVLDHRDERAADREARTIKRVDEARDRKSTRLNSSH